MEQIEVDFYRTREGKVPFEDWYYSLKDSRVKDIVQARIAKVRAGNFGDCKWVDEGVHEFRIHYGPGYRIYFGQLGRKVVVLLCGGDKRSQAADIGKAIHYWQDFRRRS